MTDLATTELTADEARELTNDIRRDLDGLLPKIKRAFEGRADKALGYDSWSAYCITELGDVRVPVGSRPEAAAELRSAGMSTRAIGSALGVSHPTVVSDLRRATGQDLPVAQSDRVISLDGRERPAQQPSPPQSLPKVDVPAKSATRPATAPSGEACAHGRLKASCEWCSPTPTPGPSDAAVNPPVDPGATPAPAAAPSSVAPQEPGPDPVSADRFAALDDQLNAEMEGTATRFRRNFSAVMARSDDVWQFDPERVAEVYAAEFDQAVRPFLQEMNRWCEQVASAHRRNTSGLRVVNGGMR